MAQATPDVSRIPSGVILTKKGERHCAEHAFDAAEIAAKNNRARLSIGREIEELLRIRREADATAARLIDLLDLHELDPDLEDGGDPEPTLGWAGAECNGRYRDEPQQDGEREPSLGWTSTLNQTSRNRLGEVNDTEDAHDGREPRPSPSMR
jgi:hypothetical protein